MFLVCAKGEDTSAMPEDSTEETIGYQSGCLFGKRYDEFTFTCWVWYVLETDKKMDRMELDRSGRWLGKRSGLEI